MKKFIILTGILLLPFLATAYDFGPEYSAMAENTNKVLTNAITRLGDENEFNARRDTIRQIKTIIKSAQKNFSGRWGDNLVPSKYYDTSEIKQNLRAKLLDFFLSGDPEALAEVADYITQHSFLVNPHNDFETLLTVGVNPIEAAIRTDHDDYLKSALEEGVIIYQHYTTTIDKDALGGGFVVGHTEDVTLKVTTSKEEIAALKEKFKK